MGYRKRTVDKTGQITDEIPESIPENVPEPTPEIPTPEPEIDDAETIRKQAIADKRRASLALARSKIIPKSTLKKQAEEAVKVKDDVIKMEREETDAMRLKYERDRVKQLEDNLNALQKLIADKPAPVPVPVETPPVKEKYKRPSRAKTVTPAERVIEKHDVPSRQPTQIIPKKSIEPQITRPPTTETLIDKSYGEQLQERLRSQAINKIMSDTFGGF
tara:strand:- start:1346 stop:1999 length:654 start_codon:yes stop_codon:yes gene_type:complete